jgi:hypothetical protein
MATFTIKTPEDVTNFPTATGTYNLKFSSDRLTTKIQIKIDGQVVTFTESASPDQVGKSVNLVDFLTSMRDVLKQGGVTLEIEQVAAARTPPPKNEPVKSHSWWWIAALVGAAVLYHSRKRSD